MDPSNQLFSQNIVNFMIAFVSIVLAAEYLNEAKLKETKA
jgi:hypothetical protein